MIWLKNTAGIKDSMLTFAFGGFLITAVAVIVSFLTSVTIGGFTLIFATLGASHVALVTLLMGATLTAYVNRRNKKDDIKAKREDLILRKNLGFSEPKDDNV